MLIHTVIFWLRPELSQAEREAFLSEGLESLRAIEAVSSLHIGRPAPVAARPVVDASYDFALTAVFMDLTAHDAYQVHPLHTAFVTRFKPSWSRVQIYDAQ